MPEEINRVLTDRISRWLLTTSPDAESNLVAEGVPADWIHLVGNTMTDTLLANLDRARERGAAARDELNLPDVYGVLTLQRPSNVDAAADVPFVFPAHRRTASKLREFGIELPPSVRLSEPLGYLDFIGLVDGAGLVLTDSGGVQEETSILGVPCLTLRDNTERPVTCELGTNRLVDTAPDAVRVAVADALIAQRRPADIPLWDGRAGERIANVLLADLT